MVPSKMYTHFCKLLNAMIIGKKFNGVNVFATSLLKFIYSEKATKFCEIFTLLLTSTT